MKISKIEKKACRYHHLTQVLQKSLIIYLTVPEIWDVTVVIVIFHFGLFLPFYPPNSSKNEISQKYRKCLGISSFYIIAPKIMIIWYTVPDIWHVADVMVIFHFGQFKFNLT